MNTYRRDFYYAECDYGEEEIQAVMDVLQNGRLALMDGPRVRDAEEKLTAVFGRSGGLMVNSGSSANLLGLAALDLPKGSRVATPALTFSTTVAPIVQLGLEPVFIDVDPKTLQITPKTLGSIDLSNISAVLAPNLMGNTVDWRSVREHVGKDVLLFEDSADTIGYRYDMNPEKSSPVDVSSTSFYASHVITGAGFGGFVGFNHQDHLERAKLLRGWGRRSTIYGEREEPENRFGALVDGVEYDAKYIFDDFGYNFLPSEISAAFVLVQLEKLQANMARRIENYNSLKSQIEEEFGDIFQVMEFTDGMVTAPLAFPMIIKPGSPFSRRELQEGLEHHGVQTRTCFTGNITRQPAAKAHGITSQPFAVSDWVMESGVLLGCHQRMTLAKVDELYQVLSKTVTGLISR